MFTNFKTDTFVVWCVGVTLDLYKHRIKPVLASILKQSIQSCTPLVNKQFAPGFHSDLITEWRHIEIRRIYSNEVYYKCLFTIR